MNIFISHPTNNKNLIDAFINDIMELNPANKPSFFYSSEVQHGIKAGKDILQAINNAISTSKMFVAFVTEDYVRSPYCWYELALAVYLNKLIIPIVFGQAQIEAIRDIIGNNTMFINMNGAIDSSILLYNTLNEYLQFEIHFSNQFIMDSPRGVKSYLGSNLLYQNILEYCNTYGIKQIKNTSIDINIMHSHLLDSKEVYIVSTTGSILIKQLSVNTLPTLLANGAYITIILPNKYSSFCEDAAYIESPTDYENNSKRFADEFDTVVYELKKTYNLAKEMNKETCGKLYIACSQTLLRQTITLSIKKDSSAWGWVSITIPPMVTRNGSPSIEISSENINIGLPQLFYKHIQSILAVAKSRNMYHEVNNNLDLPYFTLEQKNVSLYWENKRAKAMQKMYERTSYNSDGCILIEVAAQHPLKNHIEPGTEFKQRLDKAFELYNQYIQNDENVSIYIPGSVHSYFNETKKEWFPENISLSGAGKKYLIDKGIPASIIIGDEANKKYKGDKGVYNSADECYVASCIFFNGNYKQLISICSPYQTIKKTLFYYHNEIVPHLQVVSPTNMFHDPINEAVNVIPNILYLDHDWQNDTSLFANKSRQERKPQS